MMKVVQRIAAAGLLLGMAHAAHAQSAALPKFNSEAEKIQWIEANPEAYRKASGQSDKRSEAVMDTEQVVIRNRKNLSSQSVSGTRKKSVDQFFGSEDEKEAFRQAHPAKYEEMLRMVENNKK
jgi:hypothetical protein